MHLQYQYQYFVHGNTFYRAACIACNAVYPWESCLSVCASVKHVDFDKKEESSAQIFIPHERSLIL